MVTAEDNARFQEALRRFDAENERDPNTELVDGTPRPHEWIDAQRLHAWVMKLRPEASEALQLASRCQHICRWELPRASYPATRPGYHQWRIQLRKVHAAISGRILREVGYDDAMAEAVQALNLKKNFPADPEARTLEDALCLTFLQWEFPDFARRTDPPKMIGILRRTWPKMSPAAHEEALRLPLPEPARALVVRALAGDEELPPSTDAGAGGEQA